MQKQKLNVDGRIGRQCKIRKRGCSSPSSSSLVQNYRLKRAILVGQRGGSSTPMPAWKTNSASPPSLQIDISVKKHMPVQKGGGKRKEESMTARKLAATLREINEVPSPTVRDNLEERNSKVETGSKSRIVKSSKPGSATMHSSDPCHCPVVEDLQGINRPQRRVSVGSHKLLLTDNSVEGFKHLRNSHFTEVETQYLGVTPTRQPVGVKTRLKEVSSCLITSKELLKVLNRIWGLEEQHSTSVSLFSALKLELDRARIQVEKLIHEQRSNHGETDYLLKQFEEEKTAWKIKEQHRIHKAILSTVTELKVEKKLRKQTERVNKKLGRELANTKASLSKAIKEVQNEKRAREILEQVCDELARGIGEDRAEVEELKRESEEVREEVEKEREMLQLADVLREERVQMKLSEAKYQFEEKNAAVDNLRSELEFYLQAKKGEEKGSSSPRYDRIKELQEYLRKTLTGQCQIEEREKDETVVVNGRVSSAESDLQSIELNMENNKSYEWRYACRTVAENDSKRILIDDTFMGRKPTLEKTQPKNVCLERNLSDGIEWEFHSKHQGESDGFDRDRLFKFISQSRKDDHEDEIERYKMIQDLRDHIVSGSGLASSQTQTWVQPLPSQDPSSVIRDGLAVLQGAV